MVQHAHLQGAVWKLLGSLVVRTSWGEVALVAVERVALWPFGTDRKEVEREAL